MGKCPVAHGERRDKEEEENHHEKAMENGKVYYGNYLGLDKILSAQHPLTSAPDELLFIITHQTYELWFKQILHEIGIVTSIFSKARVPPSEMLQATRRLHRVVEIQRILIQQFRILETMTPMDFMDFRNALVPASGFQSVQFRELEIRMGLPQERRSRLNGCVFLEALSTDHKDYLEDVDAKASLFDVIERWLERTPFVEHEQWSFWKEYEGAVNKMIAREREHVRNEWNKGTKINQEELTSYVDKMQASFDALFDKEKYEAQRAKGLMRFTHKAMQAALLIKLYRNEPIFHLPFELLNTLVEIDENISLWRHSHATMVHRMIGSKVGTGGSSGVSYLRSTTGNRYKVFNDLANIATYIIPSDELPKIPDSARNIFTFTHDP